MFTLSEIAEIKDRIFRLVDFDYTGEIKIEEYDGISLRYKDGIAQIGCATRSQFARACFLLAMELSKGNKEIEIIEKPCFKELGTMLSVQCPMTVSGVISYMEHMAALGFNYILLYMETVYEVKGYPFFGYMRGRYSEDELKKIDEEGAKLGIEVIPCIQTFGHLGDYLRWPGTGDVADTGAVLLVENEKTYEFIDAMISTVNRCFRSERIHIGCDEARGFGLGRYTLTHPRPDKDKLIELYNSHVSRVKDICHSYGLKPMMWSDMPFRLGGDGNSDEYDAKSVIPESVMHAVSDIGMCFWDYYHFDYETYDKNLKRHKELFAKSEVIFSGGVWVIDDNIMNMPQTMGTSVPALKACIDNKIDSVNATIWGSAQNTNLEQSIPGLAIYSEYCYRGRDCSPERIHEIASFISKMSWGFIEAISEFQLGFKCCLKLGSRLLWTDILYQLMRFDMNYDVAVKRLTKALKKVEVEYCKDELFKEFCIKLFKTAIIKAKIFRDLRPAYNNGDFETIRKIADELIEEALPYYERINEIKQELWLRSTKTFGIEHVQFEFAGIIERAKFVQKLLRCYVNGEIERIEELEQEVLDEGYIDWIKNSSHMRSSFPDYI